MAKMFPLYRRSKGLNVFVDPARADYDPDTGLVDLVACNNIVLDSTGRISRRKGFTQDINASSVHSVYPYLAGYLYGESGSLKYSLKGTALRTGLSGARLCYATVGDRVYYSNESVNGYVEDEADHSWTAGTYTGPDSTKTVSDPPAGQVMEVWNGRMWIAKDDLVFHSEPFAYNWFDWARGVTQFPGHVTLIKGVSDGIYIGTYDDIYFHQGSGPQDMQQIKVANYGAILGAVALSYKSGVSLGLQDPRQYAILASRNGLCAAGPEGRFINLTEERVVYPTANRGSVVIRDENILFLLEE